LEEGDAQIKRDLDQGLRDEVRIMTVHGAKGLQAPVVILADTMQVPQPDGGLMWYGGDGRLGKEAEALLWPPRSRVRERSAQRLAAEQRTRQDEEYRRLLYVAMTRAEDRLYIAGYGTRRAPPDAAWWNVIARGLEPVAEKFAFESHPGRPDDGPEMAWQGDGFRLQMPQTADPDSCREVDASATDTPELPGWVDTMAPEEPEPPRPLVPSRPTLPEPTTRSPLGNDNGLAFQRGVLVHRLLQTLPNLEESDRSGAARAFLSRPIHGLKLDQVDALVDETLAVLGDTACAPLFGPGSRAEVPVAGVVRGRAISGRIDRLVVGSGGVKILDFKTNRLPPGRPEDVPVLYLRQMSAYRALLRKIYENQEVECLFLWTDGPRLMPLDAKLLDAYEP
jgi:ATP-dependent helicase/nuclease subunit A